MGGTDVAVERSSEEIIVSIGVDIMSSCTILGEDAHPDVNIRNRNTRIGYFSCIIYL